MKYIILLLISTSALAGLKYERFDDKGNNQGYIIVDNEAQFITRALKMIKAASWMKCDWKSDTHPLNIKKSSTFIEIITPDDPETTEVDETVTQEVTIDTYCHPKTFNFTVSDITQQLADEKAARLAEKEERQQIKAMISNVNESDKPNWEKRLLKRLIRDMKD